MSFSQERDVHELVRSKRHVEINYKTNPLIKDNKPQKQVKELFYQYWS